LGISCWLDDQGLLRPHLSLWLSLGTEFSNSSDEFLPVHILGWFGQFDEIPELLILLILIHLILVSHLGKPLNLFCLLLQIRTEHSKIIEHLEPLRK